MLVVLEQKLHGAHVPSVVQNSWPTHSEWRVHSGGVGVVVEVMNVVDEVTTVVVEVRSVEVEVKSVVVEVTSVEVVENAVDVSGLGERFDGVCRSRRPLCSP